MSEDLLLAINHEATRRMTSLVAPQASEQHGPEMLRLSMGPLFEQVRSALTLSLHELPVDLGFLYGPLVEDRAGTPLVWDRAGRRQPLWELSNRRKSLPQLFSRASGSNSGSSAGMMLQDPCHVDVDMIEFSSCADCGQDGSSCERGKHKPSVHVQRP